MAKTVEMITTMANPDLVLTAGQTYRLVDTVANELIRVNAAREVTNPKKLAKAKKPDHAPDPGDEFKGKPATHDGPDDDDGDDDDNDDAPAKADAKAAKAAAKAVKTADPNAGK